MIINIINFFFFFLHEDNWYWIKNIKYIFLNGGGLKIE